MAGNTGYTPVSASDDFNPPEDITNVYKHFDPLVGETIDTEAHLPSPTWVGRTIWVVDEGYQAVWSGDENGWIDAGGSDSGWVVDRAASPAIWHRIKGGIVYVWVDGAFNAPNNADTRVAAAIIPDPARPAAGPSGNGWVRAGAYLTGRAGTLSVNGNGDVYVSNYSGAATSSVSGILSYFLD